VTDTTHRRTSRGRPDALPGQPTPRARRGRQPIRRHAAPPAATPTAAGRYAHAAAGCHAAGFRHGTSAATRSLAIATPRPSPAAPQPSPAAAPEPQPQPTPAVAGDRGDERPSTVPSAGLRRPVTAGRGPDRPCKVARPDTEGDERRLRRHPAVPLALADRPSAEATAGESVLPEHSRVSGGRPHAQAASGAALIPSGSQARISRKISMAPTEPRQQFVLDSRGSRAWYNIAATCRSPRHRHPGTRQRSGPETWPRSSRWN
jgi:hypothetical protein